QIARREAQACIELAEALVGHNILAGKQASTTNVLCTDRDLREPPTFFPQADFEVDRLVLVVLVPCYRAVAYALHVRVAIYTLEPRKGLHRDVVARIRRGVTSGKCEFAFFCHASGRRLQQAN